MADARSVDAFRENAHAAVDWLADLLQRIEDLPVESTVLPGSIRAALPPAAPEEPEPFDAILRDLDDVILPGITHWQHPGWFAYFPGNTSPPAIVGELIAAGLGVQGMLWSTSPAATELESHVLDWLVDLLGLPAAWRVDTGPGGGVIQASASDATHTALVAARHRLRGQAPTSAERVAYGSVQAHSSVEKGARVAGYERFRAVDVDTDLAIRPEALRSAILDDLAHGRLPAFVCSTVGTTGTAAVDPVAAIGAIAAEHGLWHHVDAAYAGTAMLCPELRHHQDGLELVNSYVFNPHKWMMAGVDCSAFWVADRSPLLEAMAITPPYLHNRASASGDVVDYRDWHVALGRRFRALKLWFVLRSFGAEGLRNIVREHLRLTGWLAARIEADDRLELAAPRSFGLVCFRHVAGREGTQRIIDGLAATPAVAATASLLDDEPYIRVCVGQTNTTERHVRGLWEIIDRLS